MTLFRPARRAHLARRRPRLEALESRTLLSGDPPKIWSPADGPYDISNDAKNVRDYYQIDGAGQSAAIIDTGVTYTHPALGGGFGPGFKVRDGYDFAQPDGDPMGSALHGTALSGIIASSDSAHPGIAPGANIVALKVFSDDGDGDFNRIADALQWVIDHHAQDQISVVNLSVSDGGNYANDPYIGLFSIGNRIEDLVKKLADLNIPVVTAAGNSFNGRDQGMGFTAVVGDSISVTSADSADHLVGNAQRLGVGTSATDLAAPGTNLMATTPSNSFMPVEGTSFAAGVVSGSIVLLQDLYKSRFGTLPKVSDVLRWLKAGTDPVVDDATGITIGRLDLAKAAALVPTPAAPPTPPPPPSQPADPAPGPANDGPKTELYVNGQFVGAVPSENVQQIFAGFANAFGPAAFDRIQLWNRGVSPNQSSKPPRLAGGPATSRASGSAKGAHRAAFKGGDASLFHAPTVRIPLRGQRHARLANRPSGHHARIR